MLAPKNMVPHVQKVLAGEYDIPGLVLPASCSQPVILDIGANVGAFTVWARTRFPDALIHSYEPNPEAFELLEVNVGSLANVVTHQVAVSNSNGEGFLYDGGANIGECSLKQDWMSNTTGQRVPLLDAADLPACDFLKIDTEGSEIDILSRYRYLDTLHAIVLEWHWLANRYRIGKLLVDAGFWIVNDSPWAVNAGLIKATKDESCHVWLT